MKDLNAYLFEYLLGKDNPEAISKGKDPEDPDTWDVGDILAGTYGYSMTLPRFFKIVKRTPSQFTLVRLRGKIVSGHRNGQWEEVATDEEYGGKPVICRLRKGRSSLKVDNYVYVKLWDGKPLYGDDMD